MHDLRCTGQQYVAITSKKLVMARSSLKPRCNGITCQKFGRMCSTITDEERQVLISAFYSTANLQLQREYIVRHVKREHKKVSKTKNDMSRRVMSNYYFLPKEGREVKVCQKMFLNTLNVSEKTVRTALAKKMDTGIVEKEQRGGRYESLKRKDEEVRNAIIDHINQFPRMESHYCRKSSTREYLHPDLTLTKMYDMFMEQYRNLGCSTSYQTYRKIFRGLNLSFHHPKKDVCGLCIAYREGKQEEKKKIEEEYTNHLKEKTEVRKKKENAKCEVNNSKVCLVFDLQQVIFLPKCNDSKLFYKRRLSNYNFTIYNIQTKECDCFLWHEGISKRGASEIASCLYQQLIGFNCERKAEVLLFADGCSGQTKNSIVAAMLLHSVCTLDNINSISLSFFVPYHGQNEGDSAHSAITTAIDTVGDLSLPS